MHLPTFIYVFDSLCSWCYAFHDELIKVIDKHPDYTLQLVSGGMFVGHSRKHALDIVSADQVEALYEPVINYGQADISYRYLKDLVVEKNYYLDSELTAVGLAAFKSYERGEKEALKFIHSTQRQMYMGGVDPNTEEYYTNILPDFDIDAGGYLKKLNEPEYIEIAREDFKFARDLNVDSFPQLLLKTSDRDYFLIAKGYTKSEDIENSILRIAQEQNQSGL